MAEEREAKTISVELAIQRELAYREKVGSFLSVEEKQDLLPLRPSSKHFSNIPNYKSNKPNWSRYMARSCGGIRGTTGGREGRSRGRLGGGDGGRGQRGDDLDSSAGGDTFIEFEGAFFTSVEAVDFYKNSSNKTICGGKWCNTYEFVHGFESIKENFTALGWSKLLVISNNYYEKLVREFFSNMREIDGLLLTVVKGCRISFDAAWINRLLECPNVGSEHFVPTKWSPIIVKSDLKEFFPNVDVQSGLGKLDMTYFTPCHRVLYYIITSILAPTQGHKTDISHVNLHLFYAIMRKIPINYGAFFIKYLMFCKSKTQHGLCFGRIITRILDAYEITLDDELAIAPTCFDIICDDSFRRMHMIHIGNKWMYKKSKFRDCGVDIMSHIGEYIYDDIGRVHRNSDRREGENETGPSSSEGRCEGGNEVGPNSGEGNRRTEEGVMDVLMQLQSKFDKMDRKIDRKMAKMNKKINLCNSKIDHIMTKKQTASFTAFMENKEDSDSEEDDVDEQE